MSWARQVIADQGVEVSDGLVAVYGSQADISAACGFARNDGRVYAYLRGLAAGGVAQCDRGVVLFDPQRLELMERALVVRRLTPRAMEVAGILRQQFGRPAADGTVTLELQGYDGGPSAPPRLADIGNVLGMSRSSANRHMSSLRSHGYLAGGRHRGGPLRLVPDPGPGPDQVLLRLVNTQAELVGLLSLAHTLRDEEQRLYGTIGADGQLPGSEPTGPLSRLAETQAALIDTFSRAHSLRDDIEDIYRLLPGSAPSAPVLRAEKGAERGAEGAIEGAERGADQEIKIRKDLHTSSLFSSEQGADGTDKDAPQMARDEARTAADGTAGQQLGGGEASRGEGWGTGDLALMCADLGEACQARGLQGANNWAGLARALAGYTKDQVEAAQRRLANDVRSNRPITNPFGLLAKVAVPAHLQHLSYFRPERAQPHLRRPSPIAQPDDRRAADEEDVDIEAAQAVDALEACGPGDELDVLDEYARSHMYRFTLRVFENLSEAGRRRARATAWRELHPLPSPDVHEQDKDDNK